MSAELVFVLCALALVVLALLFGLALCRAQPRETLMTFASPHGLARGDRICDQHVCFEIAHVLDTHTVTIYDD